MLLREILTEPRVGERTINIIRWHLFWADYPHPREATVEHLVDLGWDGLAAVSGIGPKTIEYVRQKMAAANIEVPPIGKNAFIKQGEDQEYQSYYSRRVKKEIGQGVLGEEHRDPDHVGELPPSPLSKILCLFCVESLERRLNESGAQVIFPGENGSKFSYCCSVCARENSHS